MIVNVGVPREDLPVAVRIGSLRVAKSSGVAVGPNGQPVGREALAVSGVLVESLLPAVRSHISMMISPRGADPVTLSKSEGDDERVCEVGVVDDDVGDRCGIHLGEVDLFGRAIALTM